MRDTLRIISILTLCSIIFIYGCSKKEVIEKISNLQEEKTVFNDDPNCVEFIALWSSGDMAEKLGRDKKWVFLNYTIDLWDTPPTRGNGNIVGNLRASSYARIIATMGDDYKVESPVNQVQGWLNKEHVKTISKKNPKTRALCE